MTSARAAAHGRSPELQRAFDAVLAARADPRRVIALLAEYPDDEDVDALLVGGEALVALGQFDAAMDAYREVERLAPGHEAAAEGVARIALMRTVAAQAPVEPAPAPRRARSPGAVLRHALTAVFALAAVGALAAAGLELVRGGMAAAGPYAFSVTGLAAAFTAVGVQYRWALAWWSAVGFTSGAAVVAGIALATATLAEPVVVRGVAGGAGALVAAALVAVALWRGRRALTA